MTDIASALREYLRSVQAKFATGDATEHSYRSLLESLLEKCESSISVTNEPKRSECGAPDLSVSRKTGHGPVTLGHVEAKDIGAPLAAIERESNRANPSTRDGEQLKRYRKALPNLVFTDYLEFRHYVNGDLRIVARLASENTPGKLTLDRNGLEAVAALLRDLISYFVQPISKPDELARRMARLTHLIRDVVVTSFEHNRASAHIRSLREAFAEVLIPDLPVDEFADMFAQTLAYGLFAARVQHDPARGRFRRETASYEIPPTNPFLRDLFAAIVGPALEQEPFSGLVDDLAHLLADTDMAAVLADFGKRTRRQDPVVHFYETFLAAYDPDLREMRGVYYTPKPVVSYIVRSVDYLLKTRFGCAHGLADSTEITYPRTDDKGQQVQERSPRVLVLDPACGTGTFLYSVIDHVREQFMEQNNAGKWSGYVRDSLLKRLFGFELLMAPYAVAHLKLGMQLAGQDLPEEQRQIWAYDFGNSERLGVYLTNTLEEALKKSELLLGV